MKERTRNLLAIQQVAGGLQNLCREVAFVGGSAMTFYINDKAAGDVRHTDDVDCVIEIVGALGLSQLEERLRGLGFVHHPTSAVICRWLYNGTVVDIMPTTGASLGFTSRWYGPGWKEREPCVLPNGATIWRLPFVYFFAAKVEAFVGRGMADWAESKDLEDLITLLDGRLGAAEELLEAASELRTYIGEVFDQMFDDERVLLETIEGHLLPGQANQNRAPFVFQAFAKLRDLS